MEISKAMLNKVLNIEDRFKCDLVDIKNDANIVFIKLNRKSKPTKRINIHELAHKCKQWAYKQGYVILSGHSSHSIGLFFCSCKGWLSENYDKQIEINHKTEPEAIFKACQWIFDNL